MPKVATLSDDEVSYVITAINMGKDARRVFETPSHSVTAKKKRRQRAMKALGAWQTEPTPIPYRTALTLKMTCSEEFIKRFHLEAKIKEVLRANEDILDSGNSFPPNGRVVVEQVVDNNVEDIVSDGPVVEDIVVDEPVVEEGVVRGNVVEDQVDENILLGAVDFEFPSEVLLHSDIDANALGIEISEAGVEIEGKNADGMKLIFVLGYALLLKFCQFARMVHRTRKHFYSIIVSN